MKHTIACLVVLIMLLLPVSASADDVRSGGSGQEVIEFKVKHAAKHKDDFFKIDKHKCIMRFDHERAMLVFPEHLGEQGRVVEIPYGAIYYVDYRGGIDWHFWISSFGLLGGPLVRTFSGKYRDHSLILAVDDASLLLPKYFSPFDSDNVLLGLHRKDYKQVLAALEVAGINLEDVDIHSMQSPGTAQSDFKDDNVYKQYSRQKKYTFSKVPAGARIAVVGFTDCTISGEECSDGSGKLISSTVTDMIETHSEFQVSDILRPVAATEELTNQAAVVEAREKGFEYVIVGETEKLFPGAPKQSKKRRPFGMSVLSMRVLRVSDGTVVSEVEGIIGPWFDKFAVEESLVKGVASQLLDAM